MKYTLTTTVLLPPSTHLDGFVTLSKFPEGLQIQMPIGYPTFIYGNPKLAMHKILHAHPQFDFLEIKACTVEMEKFDYRTTLEQRSLLTMDVLEKYWEDCRSTLDGFENIDRNQMKRDSKNNPNPLFATIFRAFPKIKMIVHTVQWDDANIRLATLRSEDEIQALEVYNYWNPLDLYLGRKVFRYAGVLAESTTQ